MIYNGLQTGGRVYDEARRHGASETEAQGAALLTGGVIGLTDRVGIGQTLQSLNRSAGAKTWRNIFAEAVIDGGQIVVKTARQILSSFCQTSVV